MKIGNYKESFCFSYVWLRLFHHCLCSFDDVMRQVAAAAAPIPHLLSTCLALLHSHSTRVFAIVERVLQVMALQSERMSLSLLEHLLSGSTQSSGSVGMRGHRGGVATPSTVEILFQLCTTQDEWQAAR